MNNFRIVFKCHKKKLPKDHLLSYPPATPIIKPRSCNLGAVEVYLNI